ncbi:MAG: WecB/TagA/CpsF family glycosyltransferase [Bacteriovoracaceae bacterium]|nr:WecB/TagA/CpsF family glycosyltransferase [Bacteroidota bacterium]
MIHIHKKISVLNIEVDNTDTLSLLQDFRSGCLFTPNIDHFVLLQHHEEFYRAYRSAEYIIMDSQIIYLLWKFIYTPFKERIAGSDFFPKFCEYHRSNEEIRVFILGGFHPVADQVKVMLNGQAGREIVVGSYSPSPEYQLDSTETGEILAMITQSRATVLAVALGTPKQELWINANRRKLPDIQMFMGIGATLDYMAGIQKRAPVWIQRIGMEWCYRLMHNPIRLFSRYLIRDISFFYYLLSASIKKYKNPFENSQT